jgi:hypothetical protein
MLSSAQAEPVPERSSSSPLMIPVTLCRGGDSISAPKWVCLPRRVCGCLNGYILRKALTIALLAIFGMPLFAPLVASAALGEANLPACCRRNGKHHCSMNLTGDLRSAGVSMGQAPAWRAPLGHCPYYPAQTAVSPVSFLAVPAAPAIFAEVVSHPALHAQTESKWRISRDRTRQKRGPPPPTSLQS